MSDLEGLDAFNVLLDRLVTAECSRAVSEDRVHSASTEATRLQRELNSETIARQSLQRETSANLVKLKAFHDAATPFVSGVRSVGSEDVDKLKKAWNDAAEACGSDDIPF